jgi:hypothetical protein
MFHAFLTLALDGVVLSASRPDSFNPRKRAPGTIPIGACTGPGASLLTVEKRNISVPTAIELRFPPHLAPSLITIYAELSWPPNVCLLDLFILTKGRWVFEWWKRREHKQYCTTGSVGRVGGLLRVPLRVCYERQAWQDVISTRVHFSGII